MSDPERDERGRFAPPESFNERLRRLAGYAPPPEPAQAAEEPGLAPEAPPARGEFDGGQATVLGAGPERQPEDMNERIRAAVARQIYGRE